MTALPLGSEAALCLGPGLTLRLGLPDRESTLGMLRLSSWLWLTSRALAGFASRNFWTQSCGNDERSEEGGC